MLDERGYCLQNGCIVIGVDHDCPAAILDAVYIEAGNHTKLILALILLGLMQAL